MNKMLKNNVLSIQPWLRLLFMLIVGFFVQVAAFVMWAIVILQFLIALVNGESNPKLRAFSASLTDYIKQTLLFLSFNSDEKPYPFNDWPEAIDTGDEVASGAVSDTVSDTKA